MPPLTGLGTGSNAGFYNDVAPTALSGDPRLMLLQLYVARWHNGRFFKPRLKFGSTKMLRRCTPGEATAAETREIGIAITTDSISLVDAEPFSHASPPMAQRMISDVLAQPDAALEMTLRPSLFSDFTGQLKLKERMEIAVQAARQRGEPLDHILLSGPPGLGKTTLANIIAKAMSANLKSTSGPTIEKAGDLAGLLTNLEEGDVLFIDEIHRLQKTIEEYLYPAMEDFKLDIIIDQGPNARSVRLNLPRFTLIGATTRSGLLTAPLLTRFAVRERLDYYVAEDLQKIVVRSARLLQVEIDSGGALEIARRSRGTPRIANNLLRRVRDYAQVKGDGRITSELADRALAMLEIDQHGLDEMDKRILETIAVKFGGGPVGLGSLAVAVGEEPDTIEEVYEPYLIMEGYVNRTAQGRVVTELSWKRLGLKPATGAQPRLL